MWHKLAAVGILAIAISVCGKIYTQQKFQVI